MINPVHIYRCDEPTQFDCVTDGTTSTINTTVRAFIVEDGKLYIVADVNPTDPSDGVIGYFTEVHVESMEGCLRNGFCPVYPGGTKLEVYGEAHYDDLFDFLTFFL